MAGRKRKNPQDGVSKEKKPKTKPSVEAKPEAVEVVTLNEIAEVKPDAAEVAEVAAEVTAEAAEVAEVMAEAHAEPPAAEKKKLKFSENKDDNVMDIESAAFELIRGYKESWLPSVKAKARQMGYGDNATRREWRIIFAQWGGAHIIQG